MSGPTLWRVLGPLTTLAKQDYPCGWERKDTRGLGALAPLFDGFLLPRISWRPGERWLAEAWFDTVRRAGKFVVFDSDDDIFTSLVSYRALELGMHDGKSLAELEGERYERVWAMQQSDGVTVSTPRLATVVRSFTDRPVIVVPNAIDVPWFRRVLRATTRQISGLTIGWAGGRRPDADLAPMAEAWARIAERFPAVTFVIQGHAPAIVTERVPAGRLRLLPWLPIERYPAGLVEVDIACAAVVDDRFNRCKSAIKAYEAAVAGAAVVATPTVYGAVIEHGRSGFLAERADEWEHALAELVSRPSLRAIMATRLRKHVERTCSLRENLWRWPAAWSAIAEDARVRRGRLVVV